MNNQVIFQERGWEDYLYWQTQDKKTLKKINQLIQDIDRSGNSNGTGKPEPLTGNYSGYWSRRIDDKNRLVYLVEDGKLKIAQCRNHYGDK